MADADQPRQPEILRRSVSSALCDVHTSLPGKVTAYDADAYTVDVALQVRIVTTDEDAPVPRLVAVSELKSVPIEMIASGGYFVHLPFTAGDPVEITFQEQDISVWLETGALSDPADLARHGLFPTARPGPRPANKLIAGLPTDALIVGKAEGLQLKIDASAMALGAAGGTLDFVALAQKVHDGFADVKAFLDAFKAHYAAHTHPVATAGSATAQTGTAAATTPALTNSPPAAPDVGSSKVKAEE
jgi:hypothetical protein